MLPFMGRCNVGDDSPWVRYAHIENPGKYSFFLDFHFAKIPLDFVRNALLRRYLFSHPAERFNSASEIY